jgi:hypothetical protein
VPSSQDEGVGVREDEAGEGQLLDLRRVQGVAPGVSGTGSAVQAQGLRPVACADGDEGGLHLLVSTVDGFPMARLSRIAAEDVMLLGDQGHPAAALIRSQGGDLPAADGDAAFLRLAEAGQELGER